MRAIFDVIDTRSWSEHMVDVGKSIIENTLFGVVEDKALERAKEALKDLTMEDMKEVVGALRDAFGAVFPTPSIGGAVP